MECGGARGRGPGGLPGGLDKQQSDATPEVGVSQRLPTAAAARAAAARTILTGRGSLPILCVLMKLLAPIVKIALSGQP